MVPANYWDGHSTQVRPVELSIVGAELWVTGSGIELRIPFKLVVVDERLGNAPRRLRLPDGACCEVSDLAALDRLLREAGHRDGWVDRIQRRRTGILLALLIFGLVAGAAYRWGVPWAADYGARRLPPAIAALISVQAMEALDGGLLEKSEIPEARQQSLRSQFDVLQSPQPGMPHSALFFRASRPLGANAFTLPDGSIVLLDELVDVVGDDTQVMAVLAHELGHAHARHGMQMLLRSATVGAFFTFYLGDISQLLAAAPAALVHARYSQQFERQADDDGARLLSEHGMSPGLLADALTSLSRRWPDASDGGYLASHPSTEERIRRLRTSTVR